ncbi:MAG TPA: nucleotide exchange factor GrpE [Myxococcota bacterium]|nr:nucleotide exchange factor GrpE [Myxococcota bacterium]
MSEGSNERDREPSDEPEDAEGGSLAPSPELAAALREATEAVEGHEKRGAPSTREPRHDPTEALIQAYKAEAEKLGRELEAAQAEAAANKERFIRVSADLDNLRRRQIKERQEALQFGHENLVKDLLNTVDNLERAIEHAKGSEAKDLDALLQGVELAQRELATVLGKHGVAVIEAEGVAFDPNVHEAVAQIEEASVPPGNVARVYQKGYRLRDRLLRPARVVVAAGAKTKPDETEAEK